MSAADPVVTFIPATPADELARFENAMGVPLPDEMRARFFEAQLYRQGNLEALHNNGKIKMRPQGVRVLLRAILQEDASVLSLSGEMKGQVTEYDARTCIAHVIEDIGPTVYQHLEKQGVSEADMPQIGDHVFVLSTVADRASKTSRSVRLWTVHCDDISMRWRPNG